MDSFMLASTTEISLESIQTLIKSDFDVEHRETIAAQVLTIKSKEGQFVTEVFALGDEDNEDTMDDLVHMGLAMPADFKQAIGSKSVCFLMVTYRPEESKSVNEIAATLWKAGIAAYSVTDAVRELSESSVI